MAVRRIRGSWYVDLRHAHERYRKRSPLNTKAGAHEYEITLRARLTRGEPIDGIPAAPPDPTFAEFARTWFDTYVRTNNKPSEVYTKAGILRRHLLPCFGSTRVGRIGVAEIEAYKAAKLADGFGAKSINNHLAVLGKCLSSAVEWRLLEARPTIKLLRVAPQKFDTVSLQERAALLRDNEEPMWNAMVRLALRTGMRPSELTTLAWSDVDFGNSIITVRASRWRGHVGSPKNNRIRWLPMLADARMALHALARRGDLVFCNNDGTALTDSMREKALMRICKRVGVRYISWYAFRHTYASMLAAEGVPLPTIMALMGHSSITTTMRYTHVTASALHEVVAALERAGQRELEFGRNGQLVVNQTHKMSTRAPVQMPAVV